MDRIAFITLTNNGYIDFTLNCLKSLENIKFEGKIKIYCIGMKCFNVFKCKGYDCQYIDDEENVKLNNFRERNWSAITQYKFHIIYENLLNHDYVCFTDGDIVYERTGFLEYCKNHIGDKDAIIQSDATNSNSDKLCTGFMFIKSNDNTKKLWDPKRTMDKRNKPLWDDQIYINDIRTKFSYNVLPLKSFPNGKFFYKHMHKSFPETYLIHFNWTENSTKKDRMKKYNKWLL